MHEAHPVVSGDGLTIKVQEGVVVACLAEEDLQRFLQALPVLATAVRRPPELVDEEGVQHRSEHSADSAQGVREQVAEAVGRVPDEEAPHLQVGGHVLKQ
eukprot:4156744-Heterocapsa_arctica.AAC.1